MARHMGNAFDELFNIQMVKLKIQNDLYQRYADDIQLALRTIDRRVKFCPMDGCMVDKTNQDKTRRRMS